MKSYLLLHHLIRKPQAEKVAEEPTEIPSLVAKYGVILRSDGEERKC